MLADKAFFTYASGEKYLALAFALVRSYIYHNGHTIPFYIVSSVDFIIPSDLQLQIRKKIIPPALVGKGLEFKLRLPELAPAKKSIFIDSDSLVYGKLEFLFAKFSGSSVNVIGTNVTFGNWVDESIPKLMQEFQLPAVIRYCGAFYYVEQSAKTSEIFEHARILYRERKFQSHISHMNEEPILSISMGLHHVVPIPDDGNIWGDVVHFDPKQGLNVFNAKSVQFVNDHAKNYKFWLPKGIYSPLIIHFGSGIYNKNPWLFDSIRLKLKFKFKLNEKLIEFFLATIVKPGYFAAKFLTQSCK